MDEPQNTVDKLDKCSVELTIIYKNAWTVSGQPVGLLAGRAGTTPLSPPLQPPQPGKAAQRKKVHAHATTVLGPTRGVIPLLNLEAIDHPLATFIIALTGSWQSTDRSLLYFANHMLCKNIAFPSILHNAEYDRHSGYT